MSDCIEWQGYKHNHGYGRIQIRGKSWFVHRLIYFMYHGYLPPVVRHSCDNPPCCNVEHLVGGTHGDNMRDMVERRRSPHGEDNNTAILTSAQVAEIRDRLATGELQRVIAADYGVHQCSISRIKAGRNWRHREART